MVRLLCGIAALVSVAAESMIAHSDHGLWQQRNYDTIRSIYNLTIYPNNLEFLNNGVKAVPNGLFAPNATGRISPIGNFSGFEDSVEYFFGLTPPIQAPLYDTWTNAKIVSFSSGCPEVASSVVYGETTGVNPNATTYGKKITTIKQIAFWRFGKNGAVEAYDAWLPTLSCYANHLYGTKKTTEFKEATIGQVCQEQQAVCLDHNQQFKSTSDCILQLSQKSFGDWDEAWGDNVVCRSLHVLLAKLRPDVGTSVSSPYTRLTFQVHCVHVGPTGGGKCNAVDYNYVYFDEEALFGRPEGETFTCPGMTVD